MHKWSQLIELKAWSQTGFDGFQSWLWPAFYLDFNLAWTQSPQDSISIPLRLGFNSMNPFTPGFSVRCGWSDCKWTAETHSHSHLAYEFVSSDHLSSDFIHRFCWREALTHMSVFCCIYFHAEMSCESYFMNLCGLFSNVLIMWSASETYKWMRGWFSCSFIGVCEATRCIRLHATNPMWP